ncbi:MAG: lysophospholipase L1-like esterase [Planctomycetota bacterium]
MKQRSDQKVEVMNWGVSGWTTMESMLNFFVNVQDWQPDLVLVHHATNDVLPRMYPEYRSDYAHFRHPWVQLDLPEWQRWLIGASQLYGRIQMEGVPTNIQSRVGFPLKDYSIAKSGALPVESTFAYERNLRTLIEYTRSQGTHTALLTMPYNPNKQFQTGPVFSTNHRGTLEHNQLVRKLTESSDCLLIDLAEGFAEDTANSAQFFRDGVHLEPGGHKLKAKLVADALIAAEFLRLN